MNLFFLLKMTLTTTRRVYFTPRRVYFTTRRVDYYPNAVRQPDGGIPGELGIPTVVPLKGRVMACRVILGP